MRAMRGKLPQSTVKLVLPSNESYESKTGCNRTLATVLWVPLNLSSCPSLMSGRFTQKTREGRGCFRGLRGRFQGKLGESPREIGLIPASSPHMLVFACHCFVHRHFPLLSWKIPGKSGTTFTESPHATNSRISGTGKGKPCRQPWVGTAWTLSPPSMRCVCLKSTVPGFSSFSNLNWPVQGVGKQRVTIFTCWPGSRWEFTP